MKRATVGLCALAFAAACGDGPVPEPAKAAPGVHVHGKLAVDIRGTVDVAADIDASGTGIIALSWQNGDTLGALGSATEIAGAVRRDAYDEHGARVLAAKLSLPPDPAGLCGAEPVSLAIALYQRGETTRVEGSLTAYCGDRFFGVPARIFRLAGNFDP